MRQTRPLPQNSHTNCGSSESAQNFEYLRIYTYIGYMYTPWMQEIVKLWLGQRLSCTA